MRAVYGLGIRQERRSCYRPAGPAVPAGGPAREPGGQRRHPRGSQVVEGQDVIDKIQGVKTGRKEPLPSDVPLETITIESITVVE